MVLRSMIRAPCGSHSGSLEPRADSHQPILAMPVRERATKSDVSIMSGPTENSVASEPRNALMRTGAFIGNITLRDGLAATRITGCAKRLTLPARAH